MHQGIRAIVLTALGLTGTMLVLGGWQAVAGVGRDITKATGKAVQKGAEKHAP